MNKKIKLLIVVVVVILIRLICIYSPRVYIRPIKIIVIDAITKKPLKNIQVIYRLKSTTQEPYFFGLIPPFDVKTESKIIHSEIYHTDFNGVVDININDRYFSDNEVSWLTEDIYCNFDLSSKIATKNRVKDLSWYSQDCILLITKEGKRSKTGGKGNEDYFINPNANYKGFEFLSNSYDLDSSKNRYVSLCNNLEFKYEGGGIDYYLKEELVEKKILTIELKRK